MVHRVLKCNAATGNCLKNHNHFGKCSQYNIKRKEQKAWTLWDDIHMLNMWRCAQQGQGWEVGIWGRGLGPFPSPRYIWATGGLGPYFSFSKMPHFLHPQGLLLFSRLEIASLLIHHSGVSGNAIASPGKPSLTTQARLSPTVISTSSTIILVLPFHMTVSPITAQVSLS